MNVKEKIRKKFEKLQNATRLMMFKSLSRYVNEQQKIGCDEFKNAFSKTVEQSGTAVSDCIQKINALYHKSSMQNTNNWRKMHGLPMKRKEKR